MTPARKEALRPYRRKLKDTFLKATAAATTPGSQRQWYVPFLQRVLQVYSTLTTEIVEGRPLSRALAKDPRRAFKKLLKVSKRDPRTLSRWAAVLANAWQSNVQPEDLPRWLKKGGGAAGRAAEVAVKRRPANTGVALPSRPAHEPSPQSDRSPEANAKSPE